MTTEPKLIHLEDKLVTSLKNKRKALKLTQQQLAEKSGLHVQTISYIERGLFSPSSDSLFRIADALGLEFRFSLEEK